MYVVGDFVMAIDDDVYGQVVRIEGDQYIVLSTDGFEVAYARKELVLDKSKLEALDFSRNFSALANENSSFKKRPKTTIQKKKEKQQPPMEVDLHIHKLVSNTKGMTNYDMMTIQLDTAKRQLDFAIHKRIPRVVFIHGVGQGVLKTELEYMFQRYENVRISDGDYRKYGLGAMEIYILQNARM